MALAPQAGAQVTRFELTGRPESAFGGQEFGAAGRYERLAGRATIALDPADPRNAVIADIAAAPRNAQGRVEASADVVILRPVEAARGNGTMLLEVPNRGRMLALPLFNESPTAAQGREPGNGFLFRQGFTLVWVGWQADFAPAAGELAIRLPMLEGVTGPMREEVVFDHLRNPAPIPLAFPIADNASARITVRARWDLPRETPADLAVAVANPREITVTRPAGYDAGAVYELTYTARDPVVSGVGFAAVRDVAAFLRREAGDANPLAGRTRRTMAFGVSQSGRFLRDFLYLGFNEDTAGQPVFDGLMPHVAGTRRMFMNSRFARPDKAPRSLQDPAWSADAFPFTYAETQNPFTEARDGLLRRCTASNTCPRVMQTDTEYEWWGARASLLVMDPGGGAIGLPDFVRAYMIAGTPHFSQPGATVAANPVCALPTNPNHAGGPMRALLSHLDAWVHDRRVPPPSQVPTLAAGTLVEAARALPAPVPGLNYTGIHVPAAQSDHTVIPPRELGRFPVFVPRMDGDGVAVAGIRMPILEAPLESRTAWNPRAEGYGPGVLCPLMGGVLPLAATRAAREAARDPRLSLEERPARGPALRAAAERLAAAGFLLPEDVERFPRE
ncbi:hypothetical protein GXW79_13560 [Roseomonas arctica]|uniref:Alpha/beta hydrolase domain-containing protein n=1 Tax=Plastoroseomonas arctica TaxID=1509237 RepID=A0AAF1JXF4_9PROT|nr:hypothetical protein [Plastoroseomonas arctica]